MKEFDFISKYLKPIAGEGAHKLSDDCANFGEYVITKDILSAGVHFFPSDEPYNLARKALRVNLSDLAACGAEPVGFMLGLALPKNMPEEWLKKFADGLKTDIAEFKINLLGGDTVYHDAPLVISITAIGKTPKQILRSGAKIGDNIFVSGEIGKGVLGLRHKALGIKDKYSEHYELPTPRVALGIKLRGVANSCIDISDGLLADLWHICEESRVGAEIASTKIPLPHNVIAALSGDPDASSTASMTDVLSGGDDYELCFTSFQDEVEGCYKIGKIIDQRLLILDGKETKPQGFEHKPMV